MSQPVETNYATFQGPCTHPLPWPTLCGVCFSLNLNKSISYLSLCFSLNSFCNETSRTWASLGPETRYCGFWLGLSPSHVGSSPKQGFGWVQIPTTWVWVPNWVLAAFESSTWVQVPVWGKWFQYQIDDTMGRWRGAVRELVWAGLWGWVHERVWETS